MRAGNTPNPQTRRVAEFVSSLEISDIPEDVRRHAKWDILDSVGCALYGQTLPIARMLEAALRPSSGDGPVPVWGTTWRTSPDTAALLNGTLVHSFEMDDLHAEAIIHPGGVTLPAVLALAGISGASGADVVAAHVAGLEVSTRVGLAVGLVMLSRGWHNNGVLGALASSSATARILRLDAEHSLHSIGIAGSLAAGLMAAQYGAMVKRMHAGHAAQTGVRAGLLAREGFTGIEALFEEPYGGYLAAFVDQTDVPEITAEFGSRWETSQVGFKPYAACGSSHTTIDVLLELRAEHGLTAAAIESIAIRSSSVTRDHVGWAYHPDSMTTAQMNLPYAAAAAVIFGQVSVNEFADDLLDRSDVCALAARVQVEPDPDIDARGRTHRHEVIVTVKLTDGRTFAGHRVSASGSAAHPMSETQLTNKFLGLAQPSVGARGAEELLDTVMSLDTAPDVSKLEDCLSRSGAARRVEVP